MTEIRFVCYQPNRMNGKHSDTLSPDKFTSLDSDVYPNQKQNQGELSRFPLLR